MLVQSFGRPVEPEPEPVPPPMMPLPPAQFPVTLVLAVDPQQLEALAAQIEQMVAGAVRGGIEAALAESGLLGDGEDAGEPEDSGPLIGTGVFTATGHRGPARTVIDEFAADVDLSNLTRAD